MRACLIVVAAALVACVGADGGKPIAQNDGGAQAEGGSAPLPVGGMGGVADPPPAMMVDVDGDGLDDALEQQLAAAYYPFFAIHGDDGCSLHGVLYRLTPHPADSTKLMIWYDVLYERDCGLNGHVGDNEVFSALVDPAQVAPDGILALRAISHQGTPCERVTTCGSLDNCAACAFAERGGAMFPIVFSSKDKHGGYVDEGTCDASFICDFGGCEAGAVADEPVFVNAGEPGAPMLSDLTSDGFIDTALGWSEETLMGYDPWSGADFGSAGNVADDLQDSAFVIDPSGC
jgi:hypothetical protein